MNDAKASIELQTNGQHVAGDTPHGADELTAQLDLNHATAPQLASTAELDDKVATEIVRNRTLQGHYTSWDDLRSRIASLDPDAMHRLRQCARIAGPV